MTRYLPIALGVVLIVGLTIPQFIMTDRLSGSNISAEQQAELLKNVPIIIGEWHGEDLEVDDTVRQTAGAVGAVSRVYRNVRTGQAVDLWLIVGHARAVASHTPDVCYPSSGFEMRASENSVYPLSLPDQPDATFLTNTFFKDDATGRRLVRVFWSWYNAAEDVDDNRSTVEWEGPTNARLRFGNSRALYKMYFTSQMTDQMETAEQSACLRFAREFIPVVNRALAEVYTEGESAPSNSAAESGTTTERSAASESGDDFFSANGGEDPATAETSQDSEPEAEEDAQPAPVPDDLFDR